MTYILTHSTSLIIYKTLFWRLKNESCDLNELVLDAGINCYFSLINLICIINFIIIVCILQCDTLLNFWNKGLSVYKGGILEPWTVVWRISRLKINTYTQKYISSVQFNRSVVPDSLRPHESQHTRPHCPSPTPGVHSDSRPSSQWCHPAISSSVVPFSSCPQSLPA